MNKAVTYVLLYLPFIKLMKIRQTNVNENMFSFTFYANFHGSVTLLFLVGFL